MKEIIKKYLERQCLTDEYLARLYKEECLESCIKYITNQARKKCEKGQTSIAIEDAVVFKWARDYFTESEYLRDQEEAHKEKEEKKNREEEAERRAQETAEEAKKKAIEERNKREHENGQLTIFDLIGA